MKRAIAALNKIKAEGVINDYAIGGAVAAMQYIEAVPTEDLDVFASLNPRPGRLLVSLEDAYTALQAAGGIVKGQYVCFDEWPVQILSPSEGLLTEALREAVPVLLYGEPTRVFTAEHVCAVALQVYRVKDRLRLASFLEARKVDLARLARLAARYGLSAKLQQVRHGG